VDFDLSAPATQVQVKLDDSNAVLTSSGWIDCTAGSSIITPGTPEHVHCQLLQANANLVDSNLDTLTVAASR
jgi:hypothetical protein